MEISRVTETLIELALSEDIGPGDITTDSLIDPGLQGTASFIAKEPLVVCGTEVVAKLFASVNPELSVAWAKRDGERVQAGERLGRVSGPFGSILKAERASLNFLQRLSGIATKTSRTVERLKGLPTAVLDTRKTTPGWRELEKYAVRAGGGKNHRAGLYDMVLIKNNHIDALGGDVRLALEKTEPARKNGMRIEIEVRNEAELRAAVAGAPDIILLDNLDPAELKRCVALIASLSPDKKIFTEASGGITEENVREFAESGVDYVSLGSITHSARAVDISLTFTDVH